MNANARRAAARPARACAICACTRSRHRLRLPVQAHLLRLALYSCVRCPHTHSCCLPPLQVRLLVAAAGLELTALKRVRMGGLRLPGSLRLGGYM